MPIHTRPNPTVITSHGGSRRPVPQVAPIEDLQHRQAGQHERLAKAGKEPCDAQDHLEAHDTDDASPLRHRSKEPPQQQVEDPKTRLVESDDDLPHRRKPANRRVQAALEDNRGNVDHDQQLE